ncbi:Phosphate import ATP-binding protein PstB [Halioglobus japonicus]|nr:Phosphate import ATP-binding protein PstB [Halioglobus japonicus]
MTNYSESPYTLGSIDEAVACCAPKPQLKVRALSVSYGDRRVLETVSMDIYRGCITALIGPSGCGKTSLLTSINRLTDMLPSARVEGSVCFEGQEILDTTVDTLRLRRRIGMIFQKPNPFPISIRRNLELPLREHGVRKRSERASRAEQALRDVGLWEEVKERLDSSALSLSGGQQQRLCIARALVLEPEILLMDEPCSALDPISSAVVEELILRLRGRYTIVIVTHNLAQAKRVANYAGFFWMTERVGKLIEFGQCQRLFDTPAHALTQAYVDGVRG